MQRKTFLGTILVLLFALTVTMKPAAAADTLTPNDFKQESFSKTIDFFQFARDRAVAAGMPSISGTWHANLYQTYINVSGFQLYYSGLINITAGMGALTVPVQSFIEHYKTPQGKDVLTSSNFIMLLAFNETATSKYPDSPDINDILYGSLTFGVSNISDLTGRPGLDTRVTVIPLTSSADKLTWEWGMTYTNLAAVWTLMKVNPDNATYNSFPVAITTYEELTFKYKLTINPTDHTAKVEASYVIGRMTNLWYIEWEVVYLFPVPRVAHLNSSGTYALNGTKTGDETIYQWLDRQHIKMSIVLFQNSLVLDHTTKSINTANDANVTDAEQDVSSGSIATETDDNEKIFEANFGTKQTYTLYNYTSGQTQGPYDAVTRTAPRLGFARNPIFSMHVALLKYVPLIVQYIAPKMFDTAKDRMLNMTYADYFYITSYPEYSGFQVTHDPTYIAYMEPATTGAKPPNIFGLVLVIAIVVVIAAAAVLVLKRRGSKTRAAQTRQPDQPQTPTTS